MNLQKHANFTEVPKGTFHHSSLQDDSKHPTWQKLPSVISGEEMSALLKKSTFSTNGLCLNRLPSSSM